MKKLHRLVLIPSRAGSTLTEVLMSLLIMSIGVVSLITLFPISTLRVIDATNMTNATVLRYNAEAIIDSRSSLIFDPDPLQATAREHVGENYIVDPLGFAVIKAAGVSATAQTGGAWLYGFNKPASVTAPLPKRYPGIPENTVNLELAARSIVALPDNYVDLGDGQAAVSPAPTATSVSIVPSSGMDLSNVVPSATAIYQVVLFDQLGIRSEIRTISTISAAPHTITWTPPLPASFPPSSIGRVQVIANEEFYTWMLSVRRRSSGSANVDVVVFVKRLIAAKDANGDGTLDGNQDEQVYSAKLVPLVAGTTTPNLQVRVEFDAAGLEPPVKRGGYLFDTRNCHWYRISSILTKDTTLKYVSLLLEQPIYRANTEDLDRDGALDPKEDSNNNGVLDTGEDVNGNGKLDGPEDTNGNGTIDEGGVVFPRGVVGVFPLELKVQ